MMSRSNKLSRMGAAPIRIRGATRRLGVRLLSIAGTVSGWDRRQVAKVGGDRMVILNLHSVSPALSRCSQAVHPDDFDALVVWLQSHFRLVTFRELEEVADDERTPVVLSFDDGYRDFIDHAAPILERHGVAANLNVIPGCVESGRPPFNVHLIDVLDRLPVERLAPLPGPGSDLALAEADPVRWSVAFGNWVKTRDHDSLLALEEQLVDLVPELESAPARPMMSAEEIRLVEGTHEIGAHSYEHDSMGLESDEFFADDLRKCEAWFTRELGRGVETYAFPNGSYREGQVQIAKDLGIERILLVGERTAERRSMVSPRITTFGRSSRELRLRTGMAMT